MEKTIFLLLVIILTAGARPSKPKCLQPSSQELQNIFTNSYEMVSSILKTHYTCLAVRGRDVYQSASVLVQYNTTQGTVMIKHFEMECDSDTESWSMSGTSLDTTNSSLFDLKTRYDCYKCITPTESSHNRKKSPKHKKDGTPLDEETHCKECNEACHGWGGGHCKSPSVGSCCPFFDSDGVCTQECLHDNCEECSMMHMTCYNGGTIDTSTNCTSCICPPGYTSTQCDVQICTLTCQNNGTCHMTDNGTMYCNCTQGYTGVNCEEIIPEPSSSTTQRCPSSHAPTPTVESPTVNPCRNGGTMTADGQCVCPPNFTGRLCEEMICSCLNGGTCITVGDGLRQVCRCPDGWTGERCEICDHSACTPSPTNAAPLERNSGTDVELIIAVIFTVIGALVILSLLSLFGLLYTRYMKRHKDQEKIANFSGEPFYGDKVIVNPVYMTPGLLASVSQQTEN